MRTGHLVNAGTGSNQRLIWRWTRSRLNCSTMPLTSWADRCVNADLVLPWRFHRRAPTATNATPSSCATRDYTVIRRVSRLTARRLLTVFAVATRSTSLFSKIMRCKFPNTRTFDWGFRGSARILTCGNPAARHADWPIMGNPLLQGAYHVIYHSPLITR